jgi:hypothetical protein
MNINNYSINAKNLGVFFAFIGAFVNDENLMVVTLIGLGKNYSQL